MDEFGPLNLQPHPGKQWAQVAAGKGDVAAATAASSAGDLHPPARCPASDGRLRPVHRSALRARRQRRRTAPSSWRSSATCARCTRPRCGSRSCSTTSRPHLSTKNDQRVGEWAAANNVELAYTPTYSSWLNRIEAQFQALRYFALDGTDHGSHREQASMIRRYIIWRNRNAHDQALRELVKRANVA